MAIAKSQPLPAGYLRMRLEDGTTGSLIVPSALVGEIELDRQLQAEAEHRREAATLAVQRVAPIVQASKLHCSPPAQLVPIISAEALLKRRGDVHTRFRSSTEEKKTELREIDALIQLGEQRVVGLSQQWRMLIGRLRLQMPHLARVIDRIEACCALAEFTRRPLRIPPLLLVGPPGVGKTHFAMAVAELLGVPHFFYALESAETVSTLTGSDKHWSNSEHGQLFKLVMKGEFANPLIVLDELDKARSAGDGYRPANALHTVLEVATSKQLRDKSVDLAFDASYVVYIATANRLSAIQASLLSRFELFFVDEPGPRAAVAMARAIGQQVVAELDLAGRFEVPTGEVLQQLALNGSPRQMHKLLMAAIGQAIVDGRMRLVVDDLLTNGAQRSVRDLGHESSH